MIEARLASLRNTKAHEYGMRFLFGGICTVFAGLIAKRFGPAIGGLFLAFPAIFPAGASLIEKHENKRKKKLGLDGMNRGRAAAGVDAAGAAIGCIGLTGFALVLWSGLSRYNAPIIILAATVTWFVLSIGFWFLRKKSRPALHSRMRNT